MIAIYARQSLDKKDSQSIEIQINLCENYINSKIHNEKIEVYSDKGYSGKNTHRPDFERLMDDVKNGQISMIVVYKLDRISRNLLDFISMYKTFEEHKIEFCSVNDTFDTSTPIGRSMLKISIVFAEMERESTQLRVKDNYYERLKDGRWPGGPAPFGFKKSKIDNIPTLEVNEDEMKTVCQIFDWYEEDINISLGKIARKLQESGIEGRKRKTFDNVSIARILKNPIYCKADKILYRYYENLNMNIYNDISEWDGKRAAIIVGKKIDDGEKCKYTDPSEQTVYLANFRGTVSSRTFIKAQERLSQNKQIRRGNAPSRMQELAGLIKCAKCGYAIKMYNEPKLSCYGNQGLHVCDARFQTALDDIQTAVQKEIESHLQEIVKINQKNLKDANAEEVKINKLKKEIDNLISHAAQSELLEQALKESIENKQHELNQLEIKRHINQKNRISPGDIDYVTFVGLTMEAKKDVCRRLIEKILLHENGDITIFWKI